MAKLEKGDKRTIVCRALDELVSHVEAERNRWRSQWGDDQDPLASNETATVSFICSAAMRHDWFALAEYSTGKKNREDGRRRLVNGRVDLWVSKPNSIDLAIEAKMAWFPAYGASYAEQLRQARNDAASLKGEATHHLALVVTHIDGFDRFLQKHPISENQSDFVWSIEAGSEQESRKILFDFTVVR